MKLQWIKPLQKLDLELLPKYTKAPLLYAVFRRPRAQSHWLPKAFECSPFLLNKAVVCTLTNTQALAHAYTYAILALPTSHSMEPETPTADNLTLVDMVSLHSHGYSLELKTLLTQSPPPTQHHHTHGAGHAQSSRCRGVRARE